jgi:hypothetical protein
MFCAALRELEPSPYHLVLDLQFRNSPSVVGDHLNRCFRREACRYPVGAAYIEMNGFDINTDRWYGDVFVYQSYGGHAEYDWLAYPDGTGFEDFALTGMERLQKVFGSKDGLDARFSEARNVAGLVLVARFQKLISCAADHVTPLNFPILSTAHDYDLIAEIPPRTYK